MSEQAGVPDEASEEQLRALLEEEMRRLRVEDMLLQSAVTLINLGGRRLGAVPGSEEERDLAQAEAAIDGVRGLMPVIERVAPEQAAPLREALSQLQMAFVQLGGPRGPDGERAASEPAAAADDPAAAADPAGPASPAESGEGGPAQRSGRLWVPGD